MIYKIVYRFNARININAARVWYKQQQNGLQKKFSTAVKETILRLKTNPEAFAIRYKNIRIAHTHSFPFSVHFYIDKSQKQIVITNIIHDKRYFHTD